MVRLAFIIDPLTGKSVPGAAVANAGISGSDIRDMMLEAVERRFGATSAPHAIEHLSDNGSAYTARIPVVCSSPQSDPMLHAGCQPTVERQCRRRSSKP